MSQFCWLYMVKDTVAKFTPWSSVLQSALMARVLHGTQVPRHCGTAHRETESWGEHTGFSEGVGKSEQFYCLVPPWPTMGQLKYLSWEWGIPAWFSGPFTL